MKLIYKKAFTLVELIVVITILAVLSTIAYSSFVWYSTWARDSVRLADIKTVYTGLNYYQTKNSKVPPTENWADIIVWWNVIQYQGNLWRATLWKIWVNDYLVDPSTKELYTYITNRALTKHQVAGFLEIDDPSYVKNKKVFANTDRTFYAKGESMWVIKDNSWDLVHRVVSSFNVDAALWNLTCYFDRKNKFQGSWTELAIEMLK